MKPTDGVRSMLFAVAVLAFAMLHGAAQAEAQTTHTFTFNANGQLTVPLFTYQIEMFDGQMDTGTVVKHDDTGYWDFNLPGLPLTTCAEYLQVTLKKNITYRGYTLETDTSYDCTGYVVRTTQFINYVYTGCGRSRCVTELTPLSAVMGTVTPQ